MLQVLEIEPVIKLDGQGPVFASPEFNCIIVCIDDIEVRHGPEPPLDPAVDIEVIVLRIVLQECGPEK